ncbi:MAG: ribosomal protein S18-alanine N-acetyltransferase [Deltaproteobacteria bacterium]|nr:ribosomal protein S18-alanine N-acetyltransferase [Deltaproteobacteria bacterium]
MPVDTHQRQTKPGLALQSRPGFGILARLEQAAFPEHPWSEDSLRALLSQPAMHALAVENQESPPDGADHLPLGYLIWSQAADQAELLRVGVVPACRRRGTARLLVTELTRLLRNQGVRQLFLEVHQSNAPAIALYQSLGFSQTGRRPGYYTHPPGDGLLFTLPLL